MTGPPPREGGPDPGRWLLLSLAAAPAGEAFLLVDALRRLGARSVEREGPRVVAVFPPHPRPDELAAEVRVAVRASTSLTDPAVSWSRLDPDAWAARLGPAPAPVCVGGLSLRLDASTAFGTAEHPTTRSCLRLLDALVVDGDRVLDVGAGSAILAIAAVLLGAGRADALEADPVACEAARRNVALNDVAGRVRVRETRVTPGSLGRRTRYDGVVANLQAEILHPLIPDLAGATAPGGWVLLSGAIRAERERVVGSAEAAGLRLEAEEVDDGWWTGRLSRS